MGVHRGCVMMVGIIGMGTGAAAAGPPLVMNEIHADPNPLSGDANDDGVVSTSDDEFVEIINISGGELDLSGWTLSDISNGGTLRHTFPLGTLIEDGCGVVVFGGGAPGSSTGDDFGGMIVQTASTAGLSLNNSGDVLRIRDLDNALVLQVQYPTAGNDTSINLNPDLTGTDYVDHSIHPSSGGALYSPGVMLDGTRFGGCPEPFVDMDSDGVADGADNCPRTSNADQADCDLNGVGDACDDLTDANNNGVADICEVTPGSITINEIRIAQSGPDVDQFVELRGPPEVSLQGLTYLVIGDGPGGSGQLEAVVDLSVTTPPARTIGASGLFFFAEQTFTLGTPDYTAPGIDPLDFGTFDNVTHLLVANFTGALDDDLDVDDDGVLDAQPWSMVVDAVGVLEETLPPTDTEWAYGAALGFVDVGPEDGTLAPQHLWRCSDTQQWMIGDRNSTASDTPGTANDSCGGLPCPADCAPPGGNGVINIDDLLGVINAISTQDLACDVAPDNGDGTFGNGVINIDDLLGVVSAFGDCPS